MTRCSSCAKELPDDARFCLRCGSPISAQRASAEYKQVTVLFADVVHSMDIASTEGPERLREIMADLLDRSTAIVTRYSGTVDKFTGDGIIGSVRRPNHTGGPCFPRMSRSLRYPEGSGRIAGTAATHQSQPGQVTLRAKSAPPLGVTPPSGSRWEWRSAWNLWRRSGRDAQRVDSTTGGGFSRPGRPRTSAHQGSR